MCDRLLSGSRDRWHSLLGCEALYQCPRVASPMCLPRVQRAYLSHRLREGGVQIPWKPPPEDVGAGPLTRSPEHMAAVEEAQHEWRGDHPPSLMQLSKCSLHADADVMAVRAMGLRAYHVVTHSCWLKRVSVADAETYLSRRAAATPQPTSTASAGGAGQRSTAAPAEIAAVNGDARRQLSRPQPVGAIGSDGAAAGG